MEIDVGFKEVGSRRGSHGSPETVAVSILPAKKKDCKPHFGVRIGAEVLTKQGWKVKDRIVFLWGDGIDLGWLKLIRNEFGLMLFQPNHCGSCYLKTTRVPEKATRVFHASDPVEFDACDGLLITLPDWFYPAE